MDIEKVYILILAFLLDLVFGDPRALPHLIVYYGKLISFSEKQLNNGKYLFFKGMISSIFLVGISFLLPYLMISYFQKWEMNILSICISVILLFYCLANKTLIKEGYAVFNTLKKEGLVSGRKRLSWIVGRETSKLNENQIRIATLETMSENLSDGVIAPLFYYAILGVPGAMAYKMINTLDSMIGYKNERYEQYGKFAAKLDDVANYIPARITALLMLIVNFSIIGISWVWKEGKKHSSPNAGYPEAALAYILDCRFGGPNYYHGSLVNKPFIGNNNREIQHEEIHKTARINYATSLLAVFCIIVFEFISTSLI